MKFFKIVLKSILFLSLLSAIFTYAQKRPANQTREIWLKILSTKYQLCLIILLHVETPSHFEEAKTTKQSPVFRLFLSVSCEIAAALSGPRNDIIAHKLTTIGITEIFKQLALCTVL